MKKYYFTYLFANTMTSQKTTPTTIETNTSKSQTWISRWRKFSFRLYLEDFNPTACLWSLAIWVSLVLFQVPIKKLLKTVVIDPLLAYCPRTWASDLVFAGFLIISITFFIYQIRKHIVPTINSLIFAVVVLISYLTFFKIDETYIFLHYSTVFADTKTYSTSFILSVLAVLISYKSYLDPLQKKATKFSLLDDFASPDGYTDLYSRSGYAASIAKHIVDTTSEVSFAIGIMGEWGSGKSDFMLRLKAALKKEAMHENIIVDFNPWRVNKADAIIEEFFKSLSKQLKPYNHSISSTINEYSSRVLKTAKETHFRLIDALIGGWFKEEDLQDKYDTINAAIKATAKRIIVFIDDVDRLTGKEVMEVLRVIRNTANFSNTFFIVGIDQSYVIDVLRNTKNFTNEEEYLKKVFQLTITLPAFKKDQFLSQIKKYLFTADMEKHYRQRINAALLQMGIDNEDAGAENWVFPRFPREFLLERMVGSIRDLKRFCNSFKIAFEILKDEAEIADLIVLELIKNKNMVVYNCIRERKIIKRDDNSSDTFIVAKEEWDKIKTKLPEADKEALEEAVTFIFTDSEYKNQRKLLLSQNFYIYFSYQLFNLVSFHEFNKALELDADSMLKTFEKWINEGKEQELSNIFTYVDDFANSSEFEKATTVLLRLWRAGSPWYEHTKQLVFLNWKYNHERYFDKDKSKHREFFYRIVSDNEIDLFVRAKLVNEFIGSIRNGAFNEAELFIGKKELRNIAYYLFDQYLNSNPDDPARTNDFYHTNEYRVVDGKAIYFSPVSRRFKKYLMNNTNGFNGYVKTLLRPSQFPYVGKLVIEPWIEEIFGDWQIFEKRLSSTSFDNKELDRLKKIILEYIPNFFASNRTPFEVTNTDDAKFIDDFLNLKRK